MGTPYRDAAGKKALEAGIQNAFIKQYGKKADCDAYVSNGTWAAAWGDPKPIVVKNPAQATTNLATTKAIPVSPYEQMFEFMSEQPVVRPVEDITSPDAVSENTTESFTMRFSTFPYLWDSAATPIVLNKSEFISLMSVRHIRPDKNGRLFSPAIFNGSRSNDNFISADGICLDFDHGQPTVEDVLKLFPGTQAAYYSTHSHTPEKPRFRVVIPLERSVNTEEHNWLVKGIKSIIPTELMACLDAGCFDRARAHYLPSCPKENKKYAFVGYQDGDPLNVKYFIRLGRKPEPAKPSGKEIPSSLLTDAVQSVPEAVTPRTFMYTIPVSGKIINLAAWAAQNPTFDLISAIDKKYWRDSAKDGKQHIVCPFEDQHTDHGADKATFIANASPPQYTSFDIHCCHTHCVGRDRLEFIQAMLEKGWLSADNLKLDSSPMIEMKRPIFVTYQTNEIMAAPEWSTLKADERRIALDIMTMCWSEIDGMIADDNWAIARRLDIPENEWIAYRQTLNRTGWLLELGGRLTNRIAKKEFDNAQNAYMNSIINGSKGGKIAAENRKNLRIAKQQGGV